MSLLAVESVYNIFLGKNTCYKVELNSPILFLFIYICGLKVYINQGVKVVNSGRVEE